MILSWSGHIADNLISGEKNFNCICTETAEFFGESPIFHAAVADGPSGVLGRSGFRDVDWAALDAFVKEKPARYHTNNQLYQPLFEGEIRVLELYAAAFDAEFEGKLHVVSIDFTYPQEPIGTSNTLTQGREINHAFSLANKQPVWYTALSYTWGAPIFNKKIKIGDRHVNITSGLAAAMRHLRSVYQSVFLWIDQICINQLDLNEKETQVPLMGMIYTRATNTLIWLGEEDGSDPNLAVKTLQEVHTRLQFSDAVVSPDDFERLQVAPADDRSWWSIRQLFRRLWFTRTWTIQEACLSRHLYMQCGKTVFSWDDIAAWCVTLDQTSLLDWLMAYDDLDAIHSNMVTTDLMISPKGGVIINQLQQRRLFNLTHQRGETHQGVSGLLDCLVMARYAAASDAKDKVYGILGFADVQLQPRYSEEIQYRDVYQEASITQLVKNAFALPLLSCVDTEDPLRPSWTPDWSTPRVTQALGYSTKVWGLYMAGGNLTVDRSHKIPVTLSEDKRKITIRGKIFDQIAMLGAVSVEPVFCIDATNMARNKWVTYTELANNPVSNTTYSAPTNSVYDAFLQTLMAGCDGTGTAPLSPDHSEVFSLILDSTTGRKPSLPGQEYSVRREKGHFTLTSLGAKKGAKVRKPVQVLKDMQIALRAALHMRRFAVTTRGYFALVPRGTRVGDEVVVFEKACVPFVVRRDKDDIEKDVLFELVGETYVHGIMKGESMDMHELSLRDITLV